MQKNNGKYCLVLANSSKIEAWIASYLLYHDARKIINWDRKKYGKKVDESEISKALSVDLNLPNNANSADDGYEFYLIKDIGTDSTYTEFEW